MTTDCLCLRLNREVFEFSAGLNFKRFPAIKMYPVTSKNSNGQHQKQCPQKSAKIVNKPRRVIVSKTVFTAESNSTGKLNNNQSNRPKKSTRSDVTFSQNSEYSSDYCKSRGDSKSYYNSGGSSSGKQSTNSSTKLNTHPRSRTSVEQSIKSGKSNSMKPRSGLGERNKQIETAVQQYYKNENFKKSSESIQGNGKRYKKAPALGTIKEISEDQLTDFNDTDYLDFSGPSGLEKPGLVDPEDDKTINELKQFRSKNYFECHSSKSRINSKGDVIGLNNHKCVYRFYLNDRLFPVPLCTDHNNTIRCVECLLPLERNNNLTENKFMNGSIQAKVRFGSDDEAKDMTLFLPVKENLIIKERRMKKNLDPEVMYFGVVKLDAYGNSVFSPTFPNNSLALRYQKGFRQNETAELCRYNSVDKDEVVII